MTRISAGVRAIELCDQHLNKERIEILRIPNAIRYGKAVVKDIPTRFKLGSGHVKFFYDKLQYLHNRYQECHQELLARGYEVQDFESAFLDLPPELYNDWEETFEARVEVVERINTRLGEMRNLTYFKEKISNQFLILEI